MSKLKDEYNTEIQKKLQNELGFKNKMAVPKLEKILVHISLGEAKDNAGVIDKVKVYLTALAGQLPTITYAKKSIASFKVTQGQPVGMVATLRGQRMYDFLEKLVNIVLPKVRDFRGISEKSFDGQGNLNIGIREQAIFPEVDYKTIDKVRGMAITIVTNTNEKEHSKKLLEFLGVPFQKGIA